MRSRLARVVGLVVVVFGLLGTTTPAAHATTIMKFKFVGQVVLDGPLGYPCADPATDLNFPKCPQGTLPGSGGPALILTTKTLPLPTPIGPIELGTQPYLHGGNTRNFFFTTTVCVNLGININKLAKAPAHLGLCVITAAGTITGWCGLATGLATGVLTDALGQTWVFRIHITVIDGMFFFQGHTTKTTNTPQTLLTRGGGEIIPIPTVSGVPGNNCAGKTATFFTAVGGAVDAGV